MIEKIDRSIARRVSLAAGAGFPSPYRRDADGGAEFVRRVGYIQIDTISVVARAHEHILWSRCGDFSAAPFAELEGRGSGARRIWEYWAHAASYLPMEDFRYSIPRMERIRRDGHEWFKTEGRVAEEVLARIRAEGPLSSRDFEDPRGKAGSWWDWKPAKRALEYLFHAGEILVATRLGFNKVFDLAERVLPSGIDRRAPSEAEIASFYVDRAEDAYGIFTEDEVAYGRKDGRGSIGEELSARVEAGRLVRIRIEGCGDTDYFASPTRLEAGGAEAPEGRGTTGKKRRAFILSPFDPFLIDRRRLRRLFDFDYSIECYLPEAKRRFGYFALPILLAGGDPASRREEGFVGLMDAKADRKARCLVVKRISIGEAAGLSGGRGLVPLCREIGRAVAEYGRFNGAERVVFERVECPGRAGTAAGSALVAAAETSIGR